MNTKQIWLYERRTATTKTNCAYVSTKIFKVGGYFIICVLDDDGAGDNYSLPSGIYKTMICLCGKYTNTNIKVQNGFIKKYHRQYKKRISN